MTRSHLFAVQEVSVPGGAGANGEGKGEGHFAYWPLQVNNFTTGY